MDHLLISTQRLIRKATVENRELPFSVYSSINEQVLLNVPITKPMLIVVLSGNKELGKENKILCQSDHFIFLSDRYGINMRNIPKNDSYFALLIEFDYEDFKDLPLDTPQKKSDFIVGKIDTVLKNSLEQFVQMAEWIPQSLWALRKKELLMLLYHQGYQDIASMMGKHKISHQIHDLFHAQHFQDITVEDICERLAMSESTLRRKLKAEGTSVQEIKDRARLGFGLHLLQSTESPIHLIADQCGYQSPSRFTDRFKNHFGLTPTELRKTRMTD